MCIRSRSRLLAGLLLAATQIQAPLAQTQRARAEVARPPTDLATLDAGLAKVRNQILDAYRHRDFERLMPALAPEVNFAFETQSQQEFLKLARAWTPEAARTFWRNVRDALTLGIARDSEDPEYVYAPYTAVLEQLKSRDVNTVVITGDNVAVRAAPTATAAVIGRLSFSIVESSGNGVPSEANPMIIDDEKYAWEPIVMPDGKTGWISEKYARARTGFRLLFQRVNGEWKLWAIAEGD
jgi:hypothetical protein